MGFLPWKSWQPGGGRGLVILNVNSSFGNQLFPFTLFLPSSPYCGPRFFFFFLLINIFYFSVDYPLPSVSESCPPSFVKSLTYQNCIGVPTPCQALRIQWWTNRWAGPPGASSPFEEEGKHLLKNISHYRVKTKIQDSFYCSFHSSELSTSREKTWASEGRW